MNVVIEFVLLAMLGMSLFIGVFYMMRDTNRDIYSYDFNIKSGILHRDVILTLHVQRALGGNVTSTILIPSKVLGKVYRIKVSGKKLTYMPLDPSLNISKEYSVSEGLGEHMVVSNSGAMVLYKEGKEYNLRTKVLT